MSTIIYWKLRLLLSLETRFSFIYMLGLAVLVLGSLRFPLFSVVLGIFRLFFSFVELRCVYISKVSLSMSRTHDSFSSFCVMINQKPKRLFFLYLHNLVSVENILFELSCFSTEDPDLYSRFFSFEFQILFISVNLI